MKILIRNVKDFGTVAVYGVHQVVESERDIEDAVETAERDNFPCIVFYFRYFQGWMRDSEFRQLVDEAKSRDTDKLVKNFLKGIDARSISFYERLDGNGSTETSDESFGTCDISGIRGSLVPCVACTEEGGELIEFEAGEWLVDGALGKIAGYF